MDGVEVCRYIRRDPRTAAPALDPVLAEAVLPTAKRLLPPDHRGGEIPFGPVLEVPAGAPAYDRLAGFLGRRAPQ